MTAARLNTSLSRHDLRPVRAPVPSGREKARLTTDVFGYRGPRGGDPFEGCMHRALRALNCIASCLRKQTT
jgi:hypothetical protein